MPRTISSGLSTLLNRRSCNTQTTLDIYPKTGSNFYFATDKVTIGGHEYAPHLIRTDVIRQSILAPTDRVRVQIQNIDKSIGGVVMAETLVRAEAVVGRLYRNEENLAEAEWVELFRGEIVPVEVNETVAVLEVVSDLVAAGFCVGNWTLADACQFVFKDPATCGYTGVKTTCNKRRKSPDGCSGRDNEHRFGGMEYPVIEISTAPSGGSSGGGGWGTCPRKDQLVPVMGDGGGIELKPAGSLDVATDWIYNPIDKTFHRLRSAEIYYDVPIVRVETTNGVCGYSSPSHPIFPHAEHELGVRVDCVNRGDDVLLFSPQRFELYQRFIASVQTVGFGDVVRIEMETGHIYGYCDAAGADLIVCHNAKPPLED